MKFEKDHNLKSNKGQGGRFERNSAQGFGTSQQPGQLDSLGELGQQNRREMSKSRLN